MARQKGTVERIPPPHERPRAFVYHVSTGKRPGRAPSLLGGLGLAAAVGAVLVLGVLTFAVVFWIALALVLVGVVSAFLRSLLGGSSARER